MDIGIFVPYGGTSFMEELQVSYYGQEKNKIRKILIKYFPEFF